MSAMFIYIYLAKLISVLHLRITSEFWQTLAKDKDLSQDTLDHILDLLSRSPPFSEKDDTRDKRSPIRIATSLPMAVGIEQYDIVLSLFGFTPAKLLRPRLFDVCTMSISNCTDMKNVGTS